MIDPRDFRPGLMLSPEDVSMYTNATDNRNSAANNAYFQQQQMSAQLQQSLGAGAIAGQAIAPQRTPEMQVAMQSLEERTQTLEKELQVLNERMRGILRESGPNAVPSAPSYAGVTPVTQAVAGVTNRIEAMIFHVRTMLDLLEL